MKRIFTFILGVAFAISASAQAPELKSEVFDLLDLERSGLEAVKELHQQGNDLQAAEALLKYYRSRTGVRTIDVSDPTKVKITDEHQKWADEALEHTFFVHKGYQPSYNYGADIDWRFWPIKDNELRWQLHRHKWFTPMGKAYRVSGDEKYAKICQEYMKYSASYVNVFDPETGCMRPMVSGAWLKPFDPREVNNHYTEANSWQYSFFAPHDVSGHMELLGGEEAYCAKIDSLFSASSKTKGRTQVDITGLIGQYAHGNEPSHHIAYLYTYAGKPWRTYEMVREIIETQYTDKPDGLCGNDDCGQMSAWYVLSAIGIYPVTPGSVDFVLTSPIFKDVVINLENGKQFHIKSDGGKYISSVTLNGQKYDKGYITFDDIKDGGELVMDLSKSKTDFAVAPECRPISSGYQGFIRNPWFEMESDIFDTSMEISIAGAPEGAKIMYKVESLRQGETLERMSDKRLAELESKGKFVEFTESFSVKKSSLVSAYVLAEDGRRSPIVRTAVYKLKDDMDIRTECVYNPQYNARGARGLIDGLRGSVNWKTGGWQGYQNTDFIAVLDLRGERRLSTFGSGYCQDARSWIWMPTEVEYYVSQDGKEYEFVGKVKNRVDPKDYTIQVDDFVLNTSPVKAKFVKVVAKNFGTIPEWHLGAGGKAFIFIDEIWVE